MQYYVYKNEENLGPLSETEVADSLRSGRFLPDDLGCRVGEDRWIDLDFFFPNMSSPAHTWMEPQNAPQPRFSNPPPQPVPHVQNSAPQWPVSSQMPQRMSPSMNQPVVYQQAQYVVQPVIIGMTKSRATFIVLGIFLGVLGIHNFYAGYAGRGIAQLLLTLLLSWTIIVPFMVWIWVIIEIISVNRDAFGNRFS